jgi:hypothetical protein
MEQRDFLKDQIEQMGRVLAKIFSDFLGFRAKGQIFQGIEIMNHRLQSGLDIEIEKLNTFTKNELNNYLQRRQLTAEHIEILSECLKEIGKGELKRNKEEAKISLEKAIELLDIADEISNTMSFDRIKKKDEIKNVLHQC